MSGPGALPQHVEFSPGRPRLVVTFVAVLGWAVYEVASAPDLVVRWMRALIFLIGAAICLRFIFAPPRVRLYTLGFEISDGWSKTRYAWTSVSEFKLMPLAIPGWIEFRSKDQHDLEAAHSINATVAGRPLDQVCETLNAFRSRALSAP